MSAREPQGLLQRVSKSPAGLAGRPLGRRLFRKGGEAPPGLGRRTQVQLEALLWGWGGEVS